MNTVTRDGWSVSVQYPRYDEQHRQLPGVVLHTFKIHDRHPVTGREFRNSQGHLGLFQHGEGYGRVFDTPEAAYDWALEHGYLQTYVRGAWCRRCRTLHTFLGRPTSFCFGQLEERLVQFCPWPRRTCA